MIAAVGNRAAILLEEKSALPIENDEVIQSIVENQLQQLTLSLTSPESSKILNCLSENTSLFNLDLHGFDDNNSTFEQKVEHIKNHLRKNNNFVNFFLHRCSTNVINQLFKVFSSHIKYLSLEKCELGNSEKNQGWLALIKNMQNNLVYLNFSFNRFTCQDFCLLAEMLKDSSKLKTFIASGNWPLFEDKCITALANVLKVKTCALEVLKIGGVQCSALAGVTELAEALEANKTLQSVSLIDNNFWLIPGFSKPFVRMVRANLETLDLSSNWSSVARISEAELLLEEWKDINLKVLILDNARISNALARVLAKGLKTNNSIVELGLANLHLENAVISEILMALANHPKLTNLNLSGSSLNGCGDAIALLIQQSTSLTSLKIPACYIPDEDFALIHAAVKSSWLLREFTFPLNYSRGLSDEIKSIVQRNFDYHIVVSRSLQDKCWFSMAQADKTLLEKINLSLFNIFISKYP